MEAIGSVSAEQPESQHPTPSACPHIVSMQHSIDNETLDWLTDTYLWGDTAQYGSCNDGRTRYQSHRVYTAAEKLEDLIVETQARREKHCRDPASDVVQEKDLQSMLEECKNAYWVWMRPESIERTWKMTRQRWHQFLRTAFRAHLFQFVGCYEMTVCGLIAPLNSGTLKIFRLAFEDAADTEDDTKRSQTCVENFTNHLLQS